MGGNTDENAEGQLRLETVVRLKRWAERGGPRADDGALPSTRVLGQSTIARAYSLAREDIRQTAA